MNKKLLIIGNVPHHSAMDPFDIEVADYLRDGFYDMILTQRPMELPLNGVFALSSETVRRSINKMTEPTTKLVMMNRGPEIGQLMHVELQDNLEFRNCFGKHYAYKPSHCTIMKDRHTPILYNTMLDYVVKEYTDLGAPKRTTDAYYKSVKICGIPCLKVSIFISKSKLKKLKDLEFSVEDLYQTHLTESEDSLILEYVVNLDRFKTTAEIFDYVRERSDRTRKYLREKL
jgi:hypothetical protein